MIDGLSGDPLPGVACVEAGGHHGAAVEAHRFRFLQDTLQGVDQVVVVFVRLEDVETGQDEFVLLLDQLVQELDIVRVSEMEPGK